MERRFDLNFKNEGEKTITVSDDGIGMTFSELNDYFLKIGRNRRVEMHKDETDGGRKVLGKKGLGKLSMFGIGKKIKISTVKSGIKNTFVMDYEQLKDCEGNVYKPNAISVLQPVAGGTSDGLSVEGLSVEGLSVEGLSVEGLSVDGLSVDGLS